MSIRISRHQVHNITIELFKRQGLTLKFKTPLYRTDKQGNTSYYHTEYAYSMGSSDKCTMALQNNSVIELVLTSETGEDKSVVYLTEYLKAKFLKRVSKMLPILEAHDDGEIDIISVGQSGTYITNKFKDRSIKFNISKTEVSIDTVVREYGDVGISISFNEASTILSLYDFLTLVYRLQSINMTELTVLAYNYLGRPELGENYMDFRVDRTPPPDKLADYNSGGIQRMEGPKEQPRKQSNFYDKRVSW